MNSFITLIIFLSSNFAFSDNELRNTQMPVLENSVLKISGPIDSHIYDSIAYMTAQLTEGTYVELNSFGGSTYWALEIARKLRELKLNTMVPSGNVCASACVYLFSAGVERLAAKDVWFGVHGARLGAGFVMEFQSNCFEQNSDDQWLFNDQKVDCQPIIDKWYEIAMNTTIEAFSFMEANGTSENLRLDYLSMDVDPNWPWQGNIIQIKDWKLEAADALEYNLVTELL